MRSRKKHLFHKAEAISKDDKLLQRLAEQCFRKAKQHRLDILEVWSGIQTLIRLVKAWSLKEYRVIPWKSLTAIVGALVYFLNPFDLIPDFLIFGYLDDLFVITNVLSLIKSDLEKFLMWEKEKHKKIYLGDS